MILRFLVISTFDGFLKVREGARSKESRRAQVMADLDETIAEKQGVPGEPDGTD